MRAAQVVATTGPADVEVREVPDAVAPPGHVLVRVASVGIAFPDLLLTRGMYQLKPEPPFTLGVDVAGTVEALGDGVEGFVHGTRVAAVVMHGGAADLVAVPADWVFGLPEVLTYDEGAALPMNYLTAEFTLGERAGLSRGETVLVHGAAGGLGTATIQVAKGMGAQVIAVVSAAHKSVVAREAGADHVILADGFLEKSREITEGRGVDVVVDVVGGDLFTDSLRCLGTFGRLMVVGFAAGQGIPQVKVNRLLLNNIDVRGVAWGAHAMSTPGYMQEQWRRLEPMIASGAVRPPISSVHPLEQITHALAEIDERRATGKVVLRLG